MQTTLNHLQKDQNAVIVDFDENIVPFKLIEMGCLPEANVSLLQTAPLGDPLYFEINGSHIAIDRALAKLIEIKIITG